MARKKTSKKQQARKQRKQQRRQARLRREKAQRSKSRSAPDTSPDNDLIADMQPFLKGTSASPNMNMMEQWMATLLSTQDVANEPELASIVIDPMLCVDTFAEVGQELGIDPEEMASLSEDEREEKQLQILEESTRRLLTDELQQDILAGLNALRSRLRKMGQREKTARAATLQSFLSEEFSRELWPMIGLVQAIVHKSMMVGFELLEVSAEVMEAEGFEEGGASLLESLEQAKSTKKAETLLSKTPGMMDHMQKRVDRLWEEGMAAIYEGELYLELFTRDELQGATEMFMEVLGYDSETGTRLEISEETKDDVGQTLITQADAYITKLLTPQRLDQLRDRLATIVNEKACDGKWLGFVFLLMEYMKAEDAVENEKGFLIKALFGEIRTLSGMSGEGDE